MPSKKMEMPNRDFEFSMVFSLILQVMRSNSPYNERRRRISTNLNRNSFDLLSTIINYENNQRYPVRGGQPPDRHNARGLRRAGDNEENAEFYDENLPPPAYEVSSKDSHHLPRFNSQTISNYSEPFRTNSLPSL